MDIPNLTLEQVKDKLKTYSYIDLLDLCEELEIEVSETKNGVEMLKSYYECLESILELKNSKKDETGIDDDEKKIFNPIKSIKFNLIDVDNSYRYFISGNTVELGNWAVEKAVELEKIDNLYSCIVEFEDLENVEYKLIRKENKNVYWENGENRNILDNENYIIWR